MLGAWYETDDRNQNKLYLYRLLFIIIYVALLVGNFCSLKYL